MSVLVTSPTKEISIEKIENIYLGKTIGELQAEVLSILESTKLATVSDVTFAIKNKRNVSYSAIASTLARLFQKRLIEREALPGPGGTKYRYSPGNDENIKRHVVEASLNRLVKAFGSEAYELMFFKLHSLGRLRHMDGN